MKRYSLLVGDDGMHYMLDSRMNHIEASGTTKEDLQVTLRLRCEDILAEATDMLNQQRTLSDRERGLRNTLEEIQQFMLQHGMMKEHR